MQGVDPTLQLASMDEDFADENKARTAEFFESMDGYSTYMMKEGFKKTA